MTGIEQAVGGGYEGIASFCRMPIWFDVGTLEADIAVVGVCIDTSTTNRSGCRFGPRAIRDESMIYGMAYEGENGFFDIDLRKRLLRGVKIVDCGDIFTIPTLWMETMELITGSVAAIRARGAVPVVLGGDHSISFPVVRGVVDAAPVHIIQFDTHLDFMDEFVGMRYSHANPMKRISELEHVAGLTQIGIRGLTNQEDWVDLAKRGNSNFFTAEEVHEKGAEFIASQIPDVENIYISIDIDALDPSIAPGTGTPEPGGLTYRQLRDLLRLAACKGNLVGLDLVEVNPLFDPARITAQVAARLIIDTLAAATLK